MPSLRLTKKEKERVLKGFVAMTTTDKLLCKLGSAKGKT